MRTGIQNDPWRIFRSMLRPRLCHTSATSNVCVIQNRRCRHILYFGENKRSFVLETSILPDFWYKVRIKYAIADLPGINKTNNHFLRRITQKSTPVLLVDNGGFISDNFYAKRSVCKRLRAVVTFSLQCKRGAENIIFLPAALICSH